MSVAGTNLLDESRFESPITEQNLPKPLLRLPDLASDVAAAPAARAKRAAADGSARKSRAKMPFLKVNWNWRQWLYAGRYGIALGVLGVLLAAAVLLIGGIGGPEVDDSAASVLPVAVLPQPNLQHEFAIPDTFEVDGLQKSTDLVSANDTLPDTHLQQQPGAKLLAPKLESQAVPSENSNEISKADTDEPQGGPARKTDDFRQVALDVKGPAEDAQHPFARQKSYQEQPMDWRYQNYPETNPKYYEYPSNTAPGWRIARENDPRVTPQARRDGTWQDSNGFRP